jgi:membrane protease YdiL (CAAX protease family)
MTDMSLALAYRTAATDASRPSDVTASSAPLGLWATLAWSAAAYFAIWSTVLIEPALHAVWGPDVRLPALLTLLPFGHIAAGGIVMIAVWWHRQSFRDYLVLSPIGWGGVGRAVGYGVLGYVALSLAFGLIALVQQALGVAPSTAPTFVKLPFNMQTMVLVASLWFSMVVAAPVVEEMLFRGLMYRGLAECRIGVVGAMVLTSVVFGLAHYPGFGWSRVIATGCIGMLFVWLRWYYGNTRIGMMAHAVTNTIGASIMTALVLLP